MKVGQRRVFFGTLAIAATLLLGGCATPHSQAAAGNQFDDPLENVNRKVFAFNQFVDRHVLVPVAKGYRAVFPPPARNSIHDFFRNLGGPLIFANDLLQGDFGLAKDTFARFTINSTLGMAGFVDLAGRWGIPYHDEDFGITLGVWGIPPGPYLVLPVLGPSDPRDLAGSVAEGFADPWNNLASDNGYTYVIFVRGVVSGIDQRARYLKTLADLERTSLDYYATLRSIYFQRRAALVRHEKTTLPPPGLTMDGGAGALASSSNSSSSSVVSSTVRRTSEVYIK